MKNTASTKPGAEDKGYPLESVGLYIEKSTQMLYPLKDGGPDMTKEGVSLHDKPDSFFMRVSDFGLGTINNILNDLH